MKRSSLALAMVLVAAAPAGAQDLLQRSRGAQGGARPAGYYDAYQGHDRLDLRVGASLPTATSRDRGYSRIGLSATLDSDFACGKFDVRANLKNLLGKEAREDMLDNLIGAVESELMYNGLVLACELSPTACQAFQHFRANSNAMLGIGYDRCQAIEAGIQDGMQGARARSLKDCVEEKRRGGASMDDALRACESINAVSGLTGGRVAEFDLGRELEKSLGLAPGEARDLQSLLSKVRLTPRGPAGEIRTDQVLEEYARVEREYAQAWTKATEAFAANPQAELDPEAARMLQPEGSPGPLPVNVQDIAQLPAPQRRVYIQWVAGLMARVTLERRVQKLERQLLAAKHVPTLDRGTLQLVERELESLRLQMRQIDEDARRQEATNQALLRVIESAETYRMDQAASSVARSKARTETNRLLEEYTLRFGQPYRPKTPPAPGLSGAVQGKGCTNCPEVKK